MTTTTASTTGACLACLAWPGCSAGSGARKFTSATTTAPAPTGPESDETTRGGLSCLPRGVPFALAHPVETDPDRAGLAPLQRADEAALAEPLVLAERRLERRVSSHRRASAVLARTDHRPVEHVDVDPVIRLEEIVRLQLAAPVGANQLPVP